MISWVVVLKLLAKVLRRPGRSSTVVLSRSNERGLPSERATLSSHCLAIGHKRRIIRDVAAIPIPIEPIVIGDHYFSLFSIVRQKVLIKFELLIYLNDLFIYRSRNVIGGVFVEIIN